MRLRYRGATPTTFMGHGEVFPDEEFNVPDGEAESYLSRPDIEAVSDSVPAADEEAPAPAAETGTPALQAAEKASRKPTAKAPPPTPEGEVSPE